MFILHQSRGTDLVIVSFGEPLFKVHMGEIQGQSLGIDVDVFTDEGKSVDGEKGELVVKNLSIHASKVLGDDDGQNILKLFQ